jgi:quercetin dioxygenase-like cupin family protein
MEGKVGGTAMSKEVVFMGGSTNKDDDQTIKGRVLKAIELVDYQDGAVVSREIARGEKGTVTIFSFDNGQGLSEHTAPFDALVYILEGEAEVIIAGEPLRLVSGEMVIMPANKPHALQAVKRFKMILTLIRA